MIKLIAGLTINSIYHRKLTALLTVIAIAFSVTLLLGVEKMRRETKASFANTISGTDLIVGARSGNVPLLLYSVFRIGDATNNISWESYQDIAKHPDIKWTIPVSLGDSHRGFRVMGTNGDYFKYYRFAGTRRLELSEGVEFEDVYDAVLGADVARELDYAVGDKIVVTHGVSKVGGFEHDTKPFHVVGVLSKTGTPVDRTIHVRLEGVEAIHIDWTGGAPLPGFSFSAEQTRKANLTPKAITSFFVGLNSKISTFSVQRMVNEYREEPLLAILPGVALLELWTMMGVAEKALIIISVFVVITGLVGMLTVILTGLNERRREMAILRSVGARPWHVFFLLVSEAGMFTLLGSVLGVALFYLLMIITQPLIEKQFGLFIAVSMLTSIDLLILALVCVSGLLMGIVPAYRAYRYSLADGMIIRI